MREQLRLDLEGSDPYGRQREGGPGLPRGRLLRSGLVALGGVAVGTAAGLGVGRPADAAPSRRQDRQILQFLLRLERLQAEFYAAAVNEGQLEGELREFAEVVGAQERRHVELLEERLGGAAGEPPTFDFGEAVANPDRFAETAHRVEELGVAAYIGQGANLTPRVVVSVARITSVEARHAAWIADFLGRNPAPRAADKAKTARQVEADVRRTGFVT
jgi:Ferritin-like domain